MKEAMGEQWGLTEEKAEETWQAWVHAWDRAFRKS